MKADVLIKNNEQVEMEEKIFFQTLNNVINVLPGNAYWKNQQGVYLGYNDSMQKIANTDLIGKTDFDLPWKDEASSIQKIDQKVMRSKKILELDQTVTMANGQKVVMLTKKMPLQDPNGNVIGILGVAFDISDRKKMEVELCQAMVRAEAARRAKSEFLRNIEHQLRTPFNGVYTLAEILVQQENEDQEKKELLDMIYHCAKELLDFINDVIDSSRNAIDNTPILAKKFDLKQLIEKVIIIEKPAAAVKKLELLLDYEENLPLIYRSDPKRIQRIILNLVSNAIKFTLQGRIEIQVKLGKKIDEKNYVIQILVKDTGIGIAKENQAFIYEQFYRVTPVNQNKYAGAGLGLHTVKQLVEELEGEIDVISEPHKGSTFICTLPLKRPLLDQIIVDEAESWV